MPNDHLNEMFTTSLVAAVHKVKGHYEYMQHTQVMQCYVVTKINSFKWHNLKVKAVDKFFDINFTEPISIFICVCAKLILLLGKYYFFRKVNCYQGSSVATDDLYQKL